MAIQVFIDTNVYENANFSLFNKQFTKLKELVEEESVEILYNEIVYQEVYQHIGDNLAIAVAQYNQVIEENRAFAPFRINDKWGEKISKIKSEDMINDLRKYWYDFIANTNATKIPINEVDVDGIVDKYFQKKYPFENKKPTEFKDAICVDSILKYGDKITDDKIYVVSTDKGFRRSFRGKDKYIIFADLNSFLNIAILQTEHLAVEIEKTFRSGELDDCISKLLEEQIYSSSVDVEDVYDDVDLLSVDIQSIEYGYIHELDGESALVISNAKTNVMVEYTVRDEDNSYYDREDGRYYWETFVTYETLFSVDLEIEVSIAIKTDEKDLSVKVEVQDVGVDSKLYLSESDEIESVIIHNTMSDYDEDDFDVDARYCPDCGCKMDYENDMGAFCIKCAPEH